MRGITPDVSISSTKTTFDSSLVGGTIGGWIGMTSGAGEGSGYTIAFSQELVCGSSSSSL